MIYLLRDAFFLPCVILFFFISALVGFLPRNMAGMRLKCFRAGVTIILSMAGQGALGIVRSSFSQYTVCKSNVFFL